MKLYKGFDKDLKCRDFQYEIGKEYEHKGQVKTCKSGFHACENPLDVFNYYPPSDSRYCKVEGDGQIDKGTDDSKVAVSKLRIGVEIGLKGIIEAGVKFILEKVDWENAKESNTGDRSAATNTGDQSAATNTGYRSAATVEGKESVAIVTGYQGKAKGSLGNWLVITERGEWNGETYPIKGIKSVKIDGKKIKSDTFYMLVDGKLVEEC